MNNRRIYLSPPDLGSTERTLLLEAFDSNWITTLGPQVDAFEREMAEKLAVPNAVAVASGTAALHLALLVLGVGRGDVVFCSDLTFAATANAIAYCGARPVFIDCSRESWNMDPALLEEALAESSQIGNLPRAVIVVDLYGQSADYRRISTICERYGVPIIEDAAEALGASYEGKPCGSFGIMGILSFNGNKIITTSGGGMLLSNTKEFTDHARLLATQARDPFPYYQHSQVGYNYRLSNLLAAIGRGQLQSLGKKVQRRREINQYYRRSLADLPGIEFMPEAAYGQSNCWLTCITVNSELFGAPNEAIRLLLEQHNIEARHIWKPMHLQPVFEQCEMVGGEVSRDLFASGLCLPSGSSLADQSLKKICDLVHSVARRI